MLRFVVLAFAVTACGGESPPPADAEVQRYRLERPCINSVVGGDIHPGAWDELVLVHACEGQAIETFQYGPDLFGVIGTEFPFRFQLFGVIRGFILGIEASRSIAMVIGPSLRSTHFTHELDDFVLADLDGIAGLDFVSVGGGMVRRAPQTINNQIEAQDEVVLLAGKPYRFIAIAELGGSALPDLFYVTDAGELGVAIQTSPDVFAAQTLATDPGTPLRPSVADVDGDGRDDVVGAAGHVFVYSSKTGMVMLLDEPAHAVAVGDFLARGVGDPVFITADRTSVRRVTVGATLTSEPLLPTGGDTMVIADMDGDRRSDIVLTHNLNTPGSWLQLHRAFTF
jgi:hypothetical protein